MLVELHFQLVAEGLCRPHTVSHTQAPELKIPLMLFRRPAFWAPFCPNLSGQRAASLPCLKEARACQWPAGAELTRAANSLWAQSGRQSDSLAAVSLAATGNKGELTHCSLLTAQCSLNSRSMLTLCTTTPAGPKPNHCRPSALGLFWAKVHGN